MCSKLKGVFSIRRQHFRVWVVTSTVRLCIFSRRRTTPQSTHIAPIQPHITPIQPNIAHIQPHIASTLADASNFRWRLNIFLACQANQLNITRRYVTTPHIVRNAANFTAIVKIVCFVYATFDLLHSLQSLLKSYSCCEDFTISLNFSSWAWKLCQG